MHHSQEPQLQVGLGAPRLDGARGAAQFGRIDILLNNAGVTRRADIMELTEADWDRIHRVNAKGVFYCPQGVVPPGAVPPKWEKS